MADTADLMQRYHNDAQFHYAVRIVCSVAPNLTIEGACQVVNGIIEVMAANTANPYRPRGRAGL